jgi:uncharacterized protein (DUF1778 family)
MSYRPLSFRLTTDEDRAIRDAAGALDLQVSQLVENAALTAAHRMGFWDGYDPSPKKKSDWRDRPARDETGASQRLTVSMNPLNLEVVRQAADHVEATVPMFCVGATLRYIANKKRFDRANRKLALIRLPRFFA